MNFSSPNQRKVKLVLNSPISRIGGKKLLRDEIIKRFPSQFDRYIEVFGGAGWVLFRKDRHAAEEIFNDADGQLINLFRCIKYHEPELERQLQFMLTSRQTFCEVRAFHELSVCTDIQRAANFYYLIKMSFGSDIRSFGCTKRNLLSAVDHLKAVQDRLASVLIEHKDFADLIKLYDRPSALHYCDPPYHGTEKYYTEQFSHDDHLRLHSCLSRLQGRFILSYNDDDYIRNLYKDFRIEAISRNHSLAAKSGSSSRYNELIIRNF